MQEIDGSLFSVLFFYQVNLPQYEVYLKFETYYTNKIARKIKKDI